MSALSDPAALARGTQGRFDAVGLGEISLDRLAFVERLPDPGDKVEVGAWLELAGGQVATAVLGVHRLGLSAALLGCVGSDSLADRALGPLAAAGVDLSGVRRRNQAPTRSATILVERAAGERTILWQRDPRLALRREELRREEIQAGRLLLLDASDPDTALWAARVAREAGRPTVLDVDAPGPGIEALIGAVDFPVVPEAFVRRAFGSEDPVAALGALEALGAGYPVVTLGARGAVGGSAEAPLWSPAFEIPVEDTTGAGDAFHAGFAWGLLNGLRPADLLRAANATAGLGCRALGAQAALPRLEELNALLGQAVGSESGEDA